MPSSDFLTVVGCEVPPGRVDGLFELLDPDLFTPTSWHDLEKQTCRVEIFLEDPGQAPAAARALRDAAALIGLEISPQTGTIARADWAEGWKRFFHTERVSDRLVVRPSWEKYAAKGGERVIVLDPGMSFGTGKHETTRACLRFLDRLAAEDAGRSVLDMGCGSGILSIGAKLLGFNSVRAFDNDPDCIRAARENAAANGVSFPVALDDLSHPHPAAGIVVANILAPVLIEFAPQVAASLDRGPGARLVLSGILDEQYPDVRAAYGALGLEERDAMLLGPWRTGLFGFGG